MAVEALTRGIINKVMHTPITTLKTAAREAQATTVIDVVRRLFNLHENEKRKTPLAERKEGSNQERGYDTDV
jgi:glutamyl-tRNA reductase